LDAIALAYFRAGRLDESLKRLDRALQTPPGDGEPARVWVALALVYQKRGDGAAAKFWRDKADAWLADRRRHLLTPGKPTPPSWNWRDYLEVAHLRNELEKAGPD
jgi:tetratricopeptide (TPR) repeat protein